MSKSRLKNPAEATFSDFMTSQGWEVTKRGWPDFMCYRDRTVALVEVKPKHDRLLKAEQYDCMAALARFGVPCYRWSPSNNSLEPIIPGSPVRVGGHRARPPEPAQGGGRITCPLCGKISRTEGWLKDHLRKECPELQANPSLAGAGVDPTLKYKAAAQDYASRIQPRR